MFACLQHYVGTVEMSGWVGLDQEDTNLKRGAVIVAFHTVHTQSFALWPNAQK